MFRKFMYEPLGVKDIRIKQFIEMCNLDAHLFRCEMCIEMWNVQSNWGFRFNFLYVINSRLKPQALPLWAA